MEWVTEYACHRDYLESGNCSLSSAQHDIAIDLWPLRQARGARPSLPAGRRAGGRTDRRTEGRAGGLCSLAPFSPGRSYTADGKEYIFYLNICGEIEATPKACNEKQAAVCQAKKPDFTQVKVAGKFQSQTLRCVNSLPALFERIVSVLIKLARLPVAPSSSVPAEPRSRGDGVPPSDLPGARGLGR